VSYSFAGWTGSGAGSYSGTNNPASIRMNGPITENAAFTQNPVHVTVQTNPAGLTFSVDGTNTNFMYMYPIHPEMLALATAAVQLRVCNAGSQACSNQATVKFGAG
jgi:hypothetical protein